MTFINAPAPPTDLVEVLASHPTLQNLPDPALQLLCAQARLHHYQTGEVLFHEGDAAPHWLLVAQGCVEVLRFDPQGDEHVFHCFHRGHSLAEAAMFMGHGRYPMTARATDRKFNRMRPSMARVLGLETRTDRKFNRMRPSMARVLGLETRSAKEG
ncbi:MAG: cyclic nucleotide-binding domain-containing protein [Giesbergeria sp.]|nr:cyclic nucleotide-binding domain-containing protein [Giesbergeria sp.]